MNNNALGGLLLAAIGVGIAVLWYRGYFGNIITKATGSLAGGTGKQTLAPFLGTVSGRAPSTGLGKAKVAA
jgi:hypothetical protein